MRISLICVQTIEGNNVLPPLGIMYIAAVAREAGYDVQMMDVDPDEINVLDKVRKFAPDLIGLSFLTTEFEKACILSHKLKAALPGVILCCGGVHTTVDTETVLRKFNVDFCVVGEGEETFLEACKRIDKGQSYEDVKGIWLLKDNRLIKNPHRELIEDLDSIPFPARDLVDFPNIYLTFPGVIRGKYIRSTNIMAGRGCYFNCSFCSIQKIFGNKYRLRNPPNVLQEVMHLQKNYGLKGIKFQDSSFASNRKWVISFCKEIIQRGIKFVWSCDTRVDIVDMEILRIMKKAGCIQVEYGIESGSPEILKILNKKIFPQNAISAVRMAQDVGIRVGASFMIGNPNEKLSDFEMTFDLAKKLKADYTICFFTMPYPGTRLWEIAKERNLIPDNINYGSHWNLRAAEFPLLAENISKDELQLYRAKFQNYFFRRNYFRRNNIIVGLQLLGIMLRNFSATWKGIKRVVKYKRWDSFIEEILVAYRKSLYRYY